MARGYSNDGMFLTVNGNSQGLISQGASAPNSIGNTYKRGHEDEITVKALNYGGSNATHKGSGRPFSQGNSDPFIINKLVDKSSPLLHNAMDGEVLGLELTCFRTSYFGRPEHFYTMMLRGCRIVSITTYTDKNTGALCEDVYFSYSTMMVNNVASSTISYSTWKYSSITDTKTSKAQIVGNLIVLNDGMVLSPIQRGNTQVYRHIDGKPLYISTISMETALSGVSVILAISGGFATGGVAWALWGASFALDMRSTHIQNDYTYALGSMGIPKTGKAGAVWATGNAVYNGFWR